MFYCQLPTVPTSMDRMRMVSLLYIRLIYLLILQLKYITAYDQEDRAYFNELFLHFFTSTARRLSVCYLCKGTVSRDFDFRFFFHDLSTAWTLIALVTSILIFRDTFTKLFHILLRHYWVAVVAVYTYTVRTVDYFFTKC
jgi:hypothetical protein